MRGKVLPPSNIPVPYLRCGACRLVFSEAFDDWSNADFEAHIYNANYRDVDPDFETVRPDGDAKTIVSGFQAAAATLRVLDYGGGNGRLAHNLREAGSPTSRPTIPSTPTTERGRRASSTSSPASRPWST